MIIKAPHIFLAGAGRSGLVMRCFAMRLMHLGFSVFVVGETTTPAISEGDLLLIGSASGETGSLVLFARQAAKQKAGLALITALPESTLGKLAQVKVQINAPVLGHPPQAGSVSIQPMGSLFEQCLLLLLDGMVLELVDTTGAGAQWMWTRHANLE